LVALALAGAPVLGAAQNSQVVNRPEVVDLTLKGVKSVDEGELLSNLAIAKSHCVSLVLTPVCWISKSPIFYKREYLDHEELARDVIRARVFYWQRGYRNATVDTIVRPAGRKAVKVTLVVTEGAPTRISGVEIRQTNQVLGRKDLRSRVSLAEGQPLNMFKLDSTRVALRNRLWDKGYANARVDTVLTIDTAARSVAVSIRINPRFIARVRDITVTGNEKVDTSTILSSLSFKPGDIYKRSVVLESQRSMYESNLFRRAAITVDSATRRDSLKDVTVDVQEAPPREARLALGFNTIDFVQVSGRFVHYNWFGGARQLNLDATIGNLFSNTLNGNGIFYDVKHKTVVGADNAKYFRPTYSASVNLQQPWFGSPNNNLSAGVFSHRRSTPGIYVDQGYGATGTFTRLLTIRWPASLTYRFEVTKVDASDIYFCVTNGVCDSLTLVAIQKAQRLSPLALTSSVDKTNNAYEPRSGFRARFDAEHASSYTFSDFRYNRVQGDGAAFLPIARRSALGGHLRLGYVKAITSTAEAVGIDDTSGVNDNLLHPRKRFYLGGATSVRGFAENQLGPRVLTISREKLRGITDTATQCANADIRTCDPNAPYIKDRDFQALPLGGNLVAEASVEFRFPVFGDFLGAVFVDGGYLAQTTDKSLPKSQAAITPGIGVRYLSPVGPIRVDVGLNPITTEKLTVVTEDTVDGRNQLITLPKSMQRTYSPVSGFLSRLALHLSIGEAY
jgi:outer membrane protein insertion porin family/translocation and assembly module TamA